MRPTIDPERAKAIRSEIAIKSGKELARVARTYGPEALEVIAEIMRDKDDPRSLDAAKTLLDRGYGKAATIIEVETKVSDPLLEALLALSHPRGTAVPARRHEIIDAEVVDE